MALGENTGVTFIGDVVVLTVPTELDVYTAPAFRDAHVGVVNAGRYLHVVDLSNTTYIDSTGLGVLVGGLKRVRAHDGWLCLAGLSERLLRVFIGTGLTKVFAIGDTVEAAAAAAREKY